MQKLKYYSISCQYHHALGISKVALSCPFTLNRWRTFSQKIDTSVISNTLLIHFTCQCAIHSLVNDLWVIYITKYYKYCWIFISSIWVGTRVTISTCKLLGKSWPIRPSEYGYHCSVGWGDRDIAKREHIKCFAM